jgi:2-dehydro-3-deoxyglucarate aldolase/4-hydroxy-2-oxoheptanedioate aldolase
LEVAEIMASAGFDWLFVDMEHSSLDFQTTQKILQVADSKISCVVRVPSAQEAWFKKCLDMGASGIMVPQVNSAEGAKAVIEACRYPPLGQRSLGISRAHGYGKKFSEYLTQANENIALILQIEHIEAVKQIESIVAVPGIDALFIGPYDLSASLGKAGELSDPQVQEAILRVEETARKEGIPLGIFGASVASVAGYLHSGYVLLAVGLDAMLLDEAAGAIVKALRSSQA